MIIESGKTNWSAEPKLYPQFTEEGPLYYGVVFGDMKAPVTTWVRSIILRDTGTVISPVFAWILIQSFETLSLCVDKQVSNSSKIVDYLKNNPKAMSISHPSLVPGRRRRSTTDIFSTARCLSSRSM